MSWNEDYLVGLVEEIRTLNSILGCDMSTRPGPRLDLSFHFLLLPRPSLIHSSGICQVVSLPFLLRLTQRIPCSVHFHPCFPSILLTSSLSTGRSHVSFDMLALIGGQEGITELELLRALVHHQLYSIPAGKKKLEQYTYLDSAKLISNFR